MCVLMGKQRDDKYEGSLEQIVKTIKTFVSSQHKKSSLIQFFKMTYLNYRLKNGGIKNILKNLLFKLVL